MGVTTLDDAGAAYDPPNVPSSSASSSSSSSSPSPRETSRPVVPPRVFSSDRTTATNKTTENRFRVGESSLALVVSLCIPTVFAWHAASRMPLRR